MSALLWFCSGCIAAGVIATTMLGARRRTRRTEREQRQLLRLRSVVHALPDGVVIGDMQGNVLDWNPAALRLHGIADVEDVRRHLADFESMFVFRHEGAVVPPAQWPYARLMRGEPVSGWEAEVERLDNGTRVFVRYDGCVVADPEDGSRLVVILLHDRTAERTAEAEKRRDAELLKTITESMGEAVFAKDLDGRYLFANAGTAKKLGKPLHEILGRRHDEIAPPAAAQVLADLDRAVIEHDGPRHAEFTIEVGGIARTYSTHRTPLRDAGGHTIGIIGVSHDVTDQRRIETELRTSRERLEEAQRIARLGHWYWEPLSGKVWWSAELRGLMGVGPSFQPTYEGFLALVHPEDRPVVVEAVNDVMRGAQQLSYDARIVHPDGTSRWSHTVAKPTRDGAGRLVRLEGIDQDITERKLSEQSLRTTEERLRQFVEHTPAPVAMFDKGMRYLHASQRWRTDFRLGDQELLGRCHYDVFPEIGEDWRAIHRRCLAGEVLARERDLLRRADGAEHWLRWEVRPWRDAKGEIGGILIFSEDITERVRAEELLRQSEHRFRSLVDALPSAVLVARAGVIDYCNHAFQRLAGAEPHRIAGRKVTDFLPLDYVELVESRRTLAPTRTTPLVLEQQIARADGSSAAVEIVGVHVVDRGAPAVVFAMHDLADRKRTVELTQQFHQAQKMESLGRLAGGIAHDFNNLLTVINGHAELLPELGHADKEQSLASIQDAGKRAARLTQQLLAFSRMAVIEPRIVDIDDQLRQSQRLLERVIGEDVELTVVPGASRSHLRIDPGQFEQVVLNLGVNARDAMPTGGRLSIATRNVDLGPADLEGFDEAAPGSYVELSVSDSGCGMPPSVLSRLFEPFFTTKPVAKGTGLGLSVVHGVVKQSGGLVRVASEEGKGTTFRLLFPVVDGPVTGDDAVPDVRDLRGRETVLLVEDEVGVRSVARMALQDHGYQVIEAANGQQAIELLRNTQQHIDLVVTDVVMPGSGGRLVAGVAANERPDAAVLFMTGYNDDAVLRHGIDSGESLLQKPFTPNALLRKVRAVLDARRR